MLTLNETVDAIEALGTEPDVILNACRKIAAYGYKRAFYNDMKEREGKSEADKRIDEKEFHIRALALLQQAARMTNTAAQTAQILTDALCLHIVSNVPQDTIIEFSLRAMKTFEDQISTAVAQTLMKNLTEEEAAELVTRLAASLATKPRRPNRS